MDSSLFKHVELLDEVQEVYAELADGITEEALLNLRPKIKRMALRCREEELFKTAEDKYAGFLVELDKHCPEPSRKLIAAWNHLDDKLSVAPNAIMFIGSVILSIPVLDYALDSFDKPASEGGESDTSK